ncbi:DNA polymerase III subunit delta' [Myxacorys almedinensis]|uniref:DNA polymerase III subunit delta n=1 Tax=Myxacorys almedinensis A TaxID=2690445 RepID=A0A8J8CK94_9CYAN|nr:DNA polymerase III subunit delta' [Myxacorys almedinensis]NDJ19623.1 DNA polymerase III subunit delta' [Myxacorys almedinensis A]
MFVFAPLIGQPQAVELLMQAIARDRVAPAYLFAGSPGIGKRLAAECFLTLLLSQSPRLAIAPSLPHRIASRNHPDLLWVEPIYVHQGKRFSASEADAAGLKRKTPPMVRLEQIREITQFLGRPPMEAPRSVVVIEAAETMPEAAANALLKTLEEPGKATIILLAPQGEALLPTLVSRCQRIPFYRLDGVAMMQVLRQVGQAEILSQPQILALAQGSPGAAIAHWHQLQTIPAAVLESAKTLPSSLRGALELARTIAKTLDSDAQLWLVDYLQQVYWSQTGSATALQLLEDTRKYLLAYVQPQLVWEVTLVSMMG